MSERMRAWLLTFAALPVLMLLLACWGGTSTLTTMGDNQAPEWACPSPVALAYGSDGPIKRYEEGEPDPVSGTPVQIPVYYEQWEREYGEGGSLLAGEGAFSGPPFPSPTPYVMSGTRYTFGQRVRVNPLFAQVSAKAGAAAEGGQLYLITIDWVNGTDTAIPINYGSQVRLSAIKHADNRIEVGERWTLSSVALEAAGLAEPPMSIAAQDGPDEQIVTLAVIAPAGTPYTVDVIFTRDAMRAAAAAATPSPAQAGTPTPNPDLRQATDGLLTVQWTAADLRIGPKCDSPGALTEWTSASGGWGGGSMPVAAPGGAPRVVQVAFAQVGKGYVWGAAGPNQFDCSGLMFWSYGQIGLRIPRSTAAQWPAMRPVASSQWQSGDLVYFDTRAGLRGTPEVVTHVGMIADINGDGQWDLIHAASPRLGVRIDYDFLNSTYYGPRVFAQGRTVR